MTSRRDFLSALPAGLALVGTTLMAPALPRADEALRVMAWEGYDDPVFFDAFVEQDGAAPLFEAVDAEALGRLRAGQQVDVGQPCLYELGAWIDGGVVRPLDTGALANWGDLWPPLRALAAGPAEGEAWFAPFDWGPASVIYRKDMVDVAPASWWVLYEERYGGRMAMQRSAEAAIGCAALALGIARPWAMNEDERGTVAALIARQREVVRTFWSDPVEVEAGLESGDLVAAYGWNDIYARLVARGVPVGFMAPQEGYLTWVCGLARIASGGADEGRIHRFVDAMLAPASGAALIARFGYGHANRRAFDLVPGEVLAALALEEPGRLLSHGLFLDRMDAAERASYAELFELAISGS